MKTIYIKQHQIGNHSASQVYYHGISVFQGNAKEAKNEYKRIKKFCRQQWYESMTSDLLRDFVTSEMSDIFLIEVVDGKPQFYNF